MTPRTDSKIPQADLVLALESARTRLAVAIAAGSKSTPPAAMRRYLETAEHLGRVMRKLRKSGEHPALSSWSRARALESIRAAASGNDPAQISRILGAIASELE